MPVQHSPVLKDIPIEVFADIPSLVGLKPDRWPNQTWGAVTHDYNKYWNLYQGLVLNEKVGKGGKVDRYPVRLNIIRPACINHAAVLLGQWTDQVVQFSIADTPGPGVNKETRDQTAKAMNLLWAINTGDDSFLEQSLFAQIFGGYFWRAAWVPNRRKWPIRITPMDPRACFPVWDGDDYNRLVSIDVLYQIPVPTAMSRFQVEVATVDQPSEWVTVHEHWDEGEYYIKVDDKYGSYLDGTQMHGPNPWYDPVLGVKVIPYVYVPRLRVGQFWGESAIPALVGPQREINRNLAHLGDGLADAMHQQPWVKNRQKGSDGLNKNRDEYLNLGMAQYGQHEPEVGRLPGAEITEPVRRLVSEDLIQLGRENSGLPNVAWGRTDASVRSALTLKYMLWPTSNLGLRYRKHSATGFRWLFYVALVMARSKRQITESLNGVVSIGIDVVSPAMIEAVLLGHKTHYAPMLPDDRLNEVNEMVQRLPAGIISPETAIERLDGADGLEEELSRIDEHRAKLAAEEAKFQETVAKFQPVAQAGQKSSKKPGDRTTQAQAQGGRKSSGNQ